MISIVIPTLGRAECVLNCLNDIDAMGHDSCEVLVVEQGSRQASDLSQASQLVVRRFFSEIPNASLARNIGLREARGSIVLFLDDDVRIPNCNFLRNHLRHYDDRSVPGVYGQVLEVGQAPTDRPDPSEIETDWGWMSLPANYSQPCRTRNGATNNLSVRREWALSVGGMDACFEKGARREETEFNLRYTKRYGPLVFDPEAGLTHLSAEGGSRTWGHVRRTVPMHHIVGHWYFLLRAIRDRTLGARGLLLELRNITVALLKNPQVGWGFLVFLQNVCRATWGFGIAFTRLMRGPRRVETLNPAVYREIAVEPAAK